MASSPVDLGTGASISFGTSSFASQLTDISFSGMARESIETTHLGTAVAGTGKIGSKTFLPGVLVDPGEMSIEGHFNPDTVPPIEASAETITITFAEGATWAGSGFMTSYEPGVPLEDKMTFSATIKWTGNITVTAST